MEFDNNARDLRPESGRRGRLRRTADEVAALAELEDAALVALCLEHDEDAWREFMRRHEPTLRRNARGAIGYHLRTILDSDALDDVIGAFYLRIIERDMLKLREWHEREGKGRLVALLTFICNGIALDHARHAYDGRVACEKAVDRRVQADRDPNRGATWFAIEDRSTRAPIKQRRNRKCADE